MAGSPKMDGDIKLTCKNGGPGSWQEAVDDVYQTPGALETFVPQVSKL